MKKDISIVITGRVLVSYTILEKIKSFGESFSDWGFSFDKLASATFSMDLLLENDLTDTKQVIVIMGQTLSDGRSSVPFINAIKNKAPTTKIILFPNKPVVDTVDGVSFVPEESLKDISFWYTYLHGLVKKD